MVNNHRLAIEIRNFKLVFINNNQRNKVITLKGKYNKAFVFTDDIDSETRKQIEATLNHPAFTETEIRIMPDCHAGAGSVVGFTSKLNNFIIPNVVGVDIGCGIYSYNLGKIKTDFDLLDNFIRKKIPHGFGIRENIYTKNNELNIFFDELIPVVEMMNLEITKIEKSIGSLGGGNHFIELGKDNNNDIWLTVHSGSRNFGLQVATFYQEKAKEIVRDQKIDLPKGTEYLSMDLGGKEYLSSMNIAQKLAHFNRVIMAEQIIEFLRVDVKREVFSIHNYIDFKDKIIRKGAIRAYENEPLVIPFNMRDGLIIGKGKGSEKWNFSAPHGAGRIMSRTKAKKSVNLNEFKKSMKGIYTTCVNKSTLDESPFVYKDMNDILKSINETVEIELSVKPLYNFKAN